MVYRFHFTDKDTEARVEMSRQGKPDLCSQSWLSRAGLLTQCSWLHSGLCCAERRRGGWGWGKSWSLGLKFSQTIMEKKWCFFCFVYLNLPHLFIYLCCAGALCMLGRCLPVNLGRKSDPLGLWALHGISSCLGKELLLSGLDHVALSPPSLPSPPFSF